MVVLAGRGWGQRTPVDPISTGSGAGGGSGMIVQSVAIIMVVTLRIVVGGEMEFQGAPSMTVCGAKVGAGGTVPEMQGICVVWGADGRGLLIIMVGGCMQGAFLSRSSNCENWELAISSALMTQRNAGLPAVAARLGSSLTGLL